jgi:hypothetical protein
MINIKVIIAYTISNVFIIVGGRSLLLYQFTTTNQVLCIHQILKKKWEYYETVHQLLIDFKKVLRFSEEGIIVQQS